MLTMHCALMDLFQNLKDIHLFAIVFVLIAIDVGILTAWVVVDRYSLSIAYFPGEASMRRFCAAVNLLLSSKSSLFKLCISCVLNGIDVHSTV